MIYHEYIMISIMDHDGYIIQLFNMTCRPWRECCDDSSHVQAMKQWRHRICDIVYMTSIK